MSQRNQHFGWSLLSSLLSLETFRSLCIKEKKLKHGLTYHVFSLWSLLFCFGNNYIWFLNAKNFAWDVKSLKNHPRLCSARTISSHVIWFFHHLFARWTDERLAPKPNITHYLTVCFTFPAFVYTVDVWNPLLWFDWSLSISLSSDQ